MKKFTDQLNREISFPTFPPQRIISLVPSITELLFDLGLEKSIVGVTKFCVHPEIARKEKIIIGGTKNVHIEKLKSLLPDLIIANKEENEKAQIAELEKKFPVWLSDVEDFASALKMIEQLGDITGAEKRAATMMHEIQAAFSSLESPTKKLKVTYLIWQNPLMTIGGDTFIQVMLEKVGFENVFRSEKRYPETTFEEILEKGTEVLILSSEPYPFGEKHVPTFQAALPGVKILLADGEMFSWYGSRMAKAANYFKKLQEQFSLL